MTDPNDLRTIEAWLRERKHTTDRWMAEICGDAADDIERLTRDVAAAETLADGYIEQIASLRLTDEERQALVAADSELSAIGHNRPPGKAECLRISRSLRSLLERMK